MLPPSCRIAACVALLAFAAQAPADMQLPGHVLRVIDGDSLVLDVRGSLYQVDLAGIDAPELNQPWGGAAADRLNATLTGMFVVATGNLDGNTLRAGLRFKDRDVALDMLYDGLAWSTIADDPQASVPHPYNAAQAQAREARRGLWSDDHPIAPWDWRAGRDSVVQ